MTEPIDSILARIADELQGVAGIDAIVLGGSRATGTASEHSDIDIGVYYGADFDVSAFQRAASQLDDAHRADCATPPGAWGPWINGGGWLTVGGVPVDLLCRDTEKVRRTLDDCLAGHLTIDYQCGHPLGFVNAIYMGEVHECRALCERTPALRRLKERLIVFPPLYRRAAMEKFLWESRFSLQCGRKAVPKQDVLYAAGSLFRSAMCLIQAAYAFHALYCLNEKGSLQRLLLQESGRVPDGFGEILVRSLSGLGPGPAALPSAFDDMDALQAQCEALFKE